MSAICRPNSEPAARVQRLQRLDELSRLYSALATEDDIYFFEGFYSAKASPRHDFGLAMRFIARAVRLV